MISPNLRLPSERVTTTSSPVANLPPAVNSLPSDHPAGIALPTCSLNESADAGFAAAAGAPAETRWVEKGRAATGAVAGGALAGGGGLAAGGARAGGGGLAAGGARAGGGGLCAGTGAVPREPLTGGGAEVCEPPIDARAAGVGLPRLIPSSARDAPACPEPSNSTQTSNAFCHSRPVLAMTSPSLSLHQGQKRLATFRHAG